MNEKEKEKIVERIMEKIGEKVEIENINKVVGRNDMILVKSGSLEQKRDTISKNYKLKEEKKRLEDDLTERERKMQRDLRKIAEKERKRGRRTWIRYGKIQIDELWWDEEENVLKN